MIDDQWTVMQRRKLQEYRIELFLEPSDTFRADHLQRMILWTEEAIAEHLEWRAASSENVIEQDHYRAG
jgi:hypothetical protein